MRGCFFNRATSWSGTLLIKSAWPDSNAASRAASSVTFLKDDFLDLRLAAPVFVVAGENQVPAALVADEFIGSRADRIVIQLVAEFIAGDFAQA